MSRFIPKSILIDLSGTIHIENTLINGTQLALERLVSMTELGRDEEILLQSI